MAICRLPRTSTISPTSTACSAPPSASGWGRWSRCSSSRRSCTRTRRCCRSASSSAWRSPVPRCTRPRCCFWMSPPAASIPSCDASSGTTSTRSPPRGWRSWSPRTSWRKRSIAIASASSGVAARSPKARPMSSRRARAARRVPSRRSRTRLSRSSKARRHERHAHPHARLVAATRRHHDQGGQAGHARPVQLDHRGGAAAHLPVPVRLRRFPRHHGRQDRHGARGRRPRRARPGRRAHQLQMVPGRSSHGPALRRAAAAGPERQGSGHHPRRVRHASQRAGHDRPGAGAGRRRGTQHRQLRARLPGRDLERLSGGAHPRAGPRPGRSGQPRGALLVQRQRGEPLVPDPRLDDGDHDAARDAAHLTGDCARVRAWHAGSAVRDAPDARPDPDRQDPAVFPAGDGVDGGVRADGAAAVPAAAARLVPGTRSGVGGVPGAGTGAGPVDIGDHENADGRGAARAHDRLPAGDDAVGVSVRYPLHAAVAAGDHAGDPGALHERVAADGIPRRRSVVGADSQHAVHARRRSAVLRPHLAAPAQAAGLRSQADAAAAAGHRSQGIDHHAARPARAHGADHPAHYPAVHLFVRRHHGGEEHRARGRGPRPRTVRRRGTAAPRRLAQLYPAAALRQRRIRPRRTRARAGHRDPGAAERVFRRPRRRPASAQLLLDGRRSNAAQITAQYVSTIMAAGAAPPANAEVVIDNWFNPNLDYRWFMLPNLVGMLSLGVALMITALSVARERELGTFDQTLVSPATPVEIALGKLLPPLLVASVQATLYLLIVTLLYGVPFRGNLLVFYAAVLTFAEACAGVGLFISSLVHTQQQAFLGAFAVLLPFALLSGFATPVENMPWWLQFVTTINPLAHMLRLMQGLFLKGASVASLTPDLVKLLEIALCTTAAAVLLFRRKAA